MGFAKQLKRAENYVERHWKPFLAAILVIQAAILISILFAYGPIKGNDTPGYVYPALNFLRSGRMLDGGSNPIGPMMDGAGNPIVLRTPGYPFLLALIYGCFGQRDFIVVILQGMMILAITGMIFSCVSQFTDHALGVLASWFYMMDIVIYTSASSISTEISFVFFVTLGIYALLRYLKTRKMRCLILCYAAMNAALLIRPNIMYLNMIVFGGLLLLSLFKKISWKKTLPYLLMFLAVYGGWSLRNAACYGKPVYTTVLDDNIFEAFAPNLYAQEENCPHEVAEAILDEEMERRYPDFYSLDRLSQAAARRDVGMTYIKKHIPGYIWLNFKGLLNEMFGPHLSFIRQLPVPQIVQTAIALVNMGVLGLCYLLYAVGFLTNIRKQTWLDWLLLFVTMYFMASTAALGYSRFRIPFYPVCIIGMFLSWRSRAIKSEAGTSSAEL